MTEKAVTPVPCLRSHDLSRFQPTSKGGKMSCDEEILRLLKQMPSLLRPCEDDPPGGSGKPTFRLVIPPDVDPTSANQLEPSWFVNIVVTITDRNGCAIYHEAHFPRNPSLRDGIKNFVDVRWSDFVHPIDIEVWDQHLAEAVAEADRWRSAKLACSQSPPPPASLATSTGQRRRRTSSGGGSAGSFGGLSQQQQVVSTTSRLSPDIAEAAASAEALLRRIIVSPLYRARWRSPNEVFYFRTISLPFLRNQNASEDEKFRSSSIVNESTSVFSPTSSFENLLLLNYHCILGKAPEGSLLEPISSSESTVFDAVAHRVAKRRTDLTPLKSATNSTTSTNSYSPNSSIEHLAKVFCFDNIFSEDDCDCNGEAAKLPEFCQNRHYRFSEHTEPQQGSIRPPSYVSAHLAPVDIDWIDQTPPFDTSTSQTLQTQSQQRPRNSSGTPQVTSTVTRGFTFASSGAFNQKDDFVSSERQRFKSAEAIHSPSCSPPPEVNKATSQHDKISIFLSLLLPEAIREIREAVSAEPDMVAQRVRAIVVRHLGPEILSKFFSNSRNHQNQQQPMPSTTANFTSNSSTYNLPPLPSVASSTTLTTSLTCSGKMSSGSSETSFCESSALETTSSGFTKTTGGQVAQQTSLLRESATFSSSSTTNTQPPKRPSLVQELSVPLEGDSLPLPPPHPHSLFAPSSNVDPYGPKARISRSTSTRSGQISCASTPSAIDSLSTGSQWMPTTRTPYQQLNSQQNAAGQTQSTTSVLTTLQSKVQQQLQPPTCNNTSASSSPLAQEVHSTAGVLEALLMGNYDPANSHLRRGSNSATSVRQRNISEAATATGRKVANSFQIMSNSGPSSASCPPTKSDDANFGFENDWNNGGNSSSGEAKIGGGNTWAHLIMSPNASNSRSSLAHLLRHGCPPSNCTPNSVAPCSLAASAQTRAPEALASPRLSTACSTRVNRLTASTGITKPLDCPLTVIVDPQPSGTKFDAEGTSVCGYERELFKSNKSTAKADGPSPPKQPRIELSSSAAASSLNGIALTPLTRKSEIRRPNEEEDLTLANSSLCRLLQGPDPPWESLTAEVDAAAAQASTSVAPPPPPPSFFELPSDVLIVGDNDRRSRFDSCPSNTRQPLSVPSQQQLGLGGTPSSAQLHPSQMSTPGNLNGPRGSSSSAPPSAVNAIDPSRSLSPSTLERNRRAAVVAAAQIAEEAEQQRRQRPSSHHFQERQRLIFQQNVGQMTTYGQGGHNALEGVLNQQPGSIIQHQQQSQLNLNYGITNNNGIVYNEYDARQRMANQRPSLEDFSRQLKEVAPNVRVAPAGYHQNMYSVEQPQQPVAPMTPNYEYSGGHLAPVSYDCQDRPQPCPAPSHLPPSHYAASSQSIYVNSGYAAQMPLIQPKIPITSVNHQYHNHQQSSFYQQSTRQLQQQQQVMYQSQRMSLQQVQMLQQQGQSAPQSANCPNCYDRQQYSYHQAQYQHQVMMPQYQSTHQAASTPPLSVVLQQNHHLPPNSQVKASLREKVVSRFQAQDVDSPSTGRPQISPVVGQRRLHPPEALSSTGGGNGYYYASPQYQQVVQRTSLSLSGNVGSRSESIVDYTNTDQQTMIQEAQPPLEFQKRMSFQQMPSVDYMLAEGMTTPKHSPLNDVTDNIICEKSADNVDTRANEDIQLTDDLVNDVLELEALL